MESPNKHRTTKSSRSKLDPLGFITRNKVPAAKGWRTCELTRASEVTLPPGYGFGIDCERNNIVVLDPDTPAALTALLDMWEENEGTREIDTYTVKTPRGRHIYLNAVDGVTIRNSASKLAQSLDVRGVGGFVNAPPTPGYKVVRRAPLLDPPEWLVARLAAEPRRAGTDGVSGDEKHSIGGIIFRLANAQEGTRNPILHWCLCRVAEMPEGKQHSALRAIRSEARMIGLPDWEIERTVASVLGHGRG